MLEAMWEFVVGLLWPLIFGPFATLFSAQVEHDSVGVGEVMTFLVLALQWWVLLCVCQAIYKKVK